MTSIWIILTLALPIGGALAVWLIGDHRPRAQHIAAVTAAVAAAAAALGMALFATGGAPLQLAGGTIYGPIEFRPDGLGVLLAVIAAVVGCLSVVFSVDYMHGEHGLGRYYGLVLLFIAAMVGLVLSDNLLVLFVFWEITALCSYALISFYNDDPRAVAGGIKALIITQVGGVGLLAGALLMHAYFETYSISTFLARAGDLPPAVLGLVAFGFLVAAIAKSAQVPLHSWLPDAMEAPTPVSALIHAATMVNAGVYLLARFYPAFAPVPGWTTAVVIVGVLSALGAGLMALMANDLKRVLAYSTISQLGFMVYAVGTGAIFASQFHLLSHAVFKALLFLAAGAIIHEVGTRDLRQMGGLGREMPFVRNAFVIGALALAGVPLFNGFFSKDLLLEAGYGQGPAWAYWTMLATAGLTALYAARVTWLVFFAPDQRKRDAKDAPVMMKLSLGVLAVGAVTTWLLAGPLSQALASTLPLHGVRVVSTLEMVVEVFSAPLTYLALLALALGLAAWWWRGRLAGVASRLGPLARAAAAGFGFDQLNDAVVGFTQRVAAALALTQTGQLNWNIAGLLGGLVLVLAILTAVSLAWRG